MTNIPSNEIVWEEITMQNGDVYFVTSKSNRDYYYLYKKTKDGVERLGKDNNPLNLEKKFIKR